LIIEDAEKRAGLAKRYKKMADIYLAEEGPKAAESGDAQTARVLDSAVFLAENLQNAPVQVIPCLQLALLPVA